MKVPLVDLAPQHEPIRAELDQAIKRVIDRGDFILGKDVELFEEEFTAFCGASYAVGVDCGLSALKLALLAFGIGIGDEVILPANTFVATASAVSFTGARPVLVDVDPLTYCIDAEQVATAITPRTRAIIPVHLYGQPADMDAILEIAEANNLVVIEDACQAHGAHYKGSRVGSLGHAAAFSFYPSKNLGAFGDGGMVVTTNPKVAEKVRSLRNYGQRVKYQHELQPYNHRLDTLQAAVLRVKLQHLDEWTEARRSLARTYTTLLEGSGAVAPYETIEARHVYHLYVIGAPDRARLQKHLQARGIGTGIHYPLPIHFQPYYMHEGFRRGQFPVTEQLSHEILSLPMYPGMPHRQAQQVAWQIVDYLNGWADRTRENGRRPPREYRPWETQYTTPPPSVALN